MAQEWPEGRSSVSLLENRTFGPGGDLPPGMSPPIKLGLGPFEVHSRGALLHDSTAARVGALFQLLVQDTTAQDFGLPSSAIRLRM